MDEVALVDGADSVPEEGMDSKARMVEDTADEVEGEEAMMVTTMVVEVEAVDEDLVEREGSGAVGLVGVSHPPRPLSTRSERTMKEKEMARRES